MRGLLDDCDLFRGQLVEFINQLIDLAVERGALVFIECLVALSARRGELLLGFEHLIDELNDSVVTRTIRIVRKVNRGDWKTFKILTKKTQVDFCFTFKASTND